MVLELDRSAIRQPAKADPLAQPLLPICRTIAINIMKRVVYELAFHLNSDLEELRVQQLAQNIENYITSAGGVISFKKEPEKIRLSYPVKHKKQAYFGYTHFTLEIPENLANIDEQVRHNNDVLRYLVVKVPADSGKVKFRFKPQKPRITTEKPAEKPTPEQSKELDKELEGILENL